MDTFLDLQTALQSDMTIGSESTLLTSDTVKLAINRAYRKASDHHEWPMLEDAEKTSTVANQEYYDYPTTWKPDSIWKLRVDGVDYGDRVAFKDYLFEKENNIPSGLKYLWANQARRFFIYPTPTANGSLNIEIWGKEAVTSMVQNTDTTIFSYSLPAVNEAIVLEALSILRIKGGEEPIRLLRYIQGALFLSMEAQNIIDDVWSKVQAENVKNERTTQFFTVPDFFRRTRDTLRTRIGDFE